MSWWIFKMSSPGSNADMDTSAPLITAVVNNALFHSNSRIKQMPSQIIHILRFLWQRLAAPDLVMKCTEVRVVRWPEIWKFIRVSYIDVPEYGIGILEFNVPLDTVGL